MSQQKYMYGLRHSEQDPSREVYTEPVLTLEEMRNWAKGNLKTITATVPKCESVVATPATDELVVKLCPAPVWLHLKAPIFGKFALDQTSLDSHDI